MSKEGVLVKQPVTLSSTWVVYSHSMTSLRVIAEDAFLRVKQANTLEYSSSARPSTLALIWERICMTIQRE